MATVIVHATDARYEGVGGRLLEYYQGEANTVGGYTIDGVEYPAKADVPAPQAVAAGEAFDPAGHTVAEVLDYLAGATPEEQERVLTAEAAGKARTSLIAKDES